MSSPAPASRPADVPPPGAGVSYVMPVLNEVRYLEPAVRSILEQETSEPCEVVLALGPSNDGTTELARRIAADDARVVLVDNPRTHIPVGLNLAIRASRYPTVVRVDAHSVLPQGYTRQALETLARTRAANVGGVMKAEGLSPFQSAVARTYTSQFGLGGPSYHVGGDEGPSESAYLGVFRRSVLDEVGLYDESVRRGEDWELNLRIRAAGYTVWFDPRLAVTYRPRETWGQLVRQFFATGSWRGELARRLGSRNGLRYFVPPALVAWLALTVVVGAVTGLASLGGAWPWISAALGAGAALYVIALLAVVASSAGGRTLGDRLRSLVVFPSVHLAWGAGFWNGLLRGAHTTHDTSRLTSGGTPT